MIWLAIAAVTASAAIQTAPAWEQVHRESLSTSSIDRNSIRRNGNLGYATLRTEFAAVPGMAAYTMTSDREFHCNSGQVRMLRSTRVDTGPNGNRREETQPGELMRVYADTPVASAFNRVCR